MTKHPRWTQPLVVLIIAVALFAAACAEETVDRPVSATGTTAAGGDIEDIGDAARLGLETYNGTCQACHAPGGIGVTGIGPALVNNVFLQGMTDDEAVAFIKVGRDPSHPDNTTGIGMPPNGGNPSLSDDDLTAVVLYLRTLQD